MQQSQPYFTIGHVAPGGLDEAMAQVGASKLDIKKPAQPEAQRTDKAAVLNSFYLYLGGRLDSVGRRASFMMALLGSFLGVASASITKGQLVSVEEKLAFLLSHPSILVGFAGMVVLLVSELAKIRASDDLLSRIGFSNDAVEELHQIYANATINDLFGEMIKNARVVGGFLKTKVRLYNTGSILFVIAVVLFVCGW